MHRLVELLSFVGGILFRDGTQRVWGDMKEAGTL